MKKTFIYLTLICTLLIGGVATASAQSKARVKDTKKRAKELKKEGWKTMGSVQTLEYNMIQFAKYLDEDPENHIEIVGIAVGSNPKIGRENAIMNGITSYAGRAKAQVVGKMKSVTSSDASSTDEEEIDKFGSAYEMGVNTKIAGLVKQHFVLTRPVNGKSEFYVYMSIDEEQAKKARAEAAKEAKKQAALGTLSEQVEEFIGEPVEEY